ncbi:acyltransferase family protein [Desertimonas flava]|uniref:acyltransferase family protein n=1 Tax=Desertimonas flava TaxID=2064846 RepID=UPI0013C4C43E|nr:acyltransferase family protein [Desertimonas flava]
MSDRPRSGAPPRAGKRGFGYQPALDGLRALSVIAVILYHAGFSWMTGGFFGVEVFFVVSGFLITSLLIEERNKSLARIARRAAGGHEDAHAALGLTGGIDLRQFWLRRARRLLPALAVVLVAVSLWAMVGGNDAQRSQLRRDLPWAVFYAGNWGQVLGDIPYYSADPPLLRHLWSLAVEEQWYLVWPLLFIGIVLLRWRDVTAAKVLAGLALVSMIATFWLHRGGPGPISSSISAFDGVDRTNFMYLSTFTRASGLLLGAAAAFVWRPWRTVKSNATIPAVDAAGGAAVAGLGVIAASATLIDGYVYQWLLPMVSILSAVAVMAAVHPGATWFRIALSWKPLVEIGRRSYGLYLWHWPIFVFAEAYHGSVARFVAASLVTVVVSEACYRYVETPVRHGALSTWWRSGGGTRGRLVPTAVAGCVGLGIVGFYASVEPFDRAEGGEAIEFVAPPTTGAPTTVATVAAGIGAPPTTAVPTTVVDNVPDLVVVGDSTADALVKNAPDGLEETFDVTNGAVPGCSVYDSGSVRSARAGFRNSFTVCEGWADEWRSAAEDAGAEIALVVLGAWDVFDLTTSDGDLLQFGTSDWDYYVAARLQEGIDALVSTGAHVGLLEVPCMRPKDVNGAAVPALPERADDARVAHLNELWRWVASQNPDTVSFVPGPDEWCGDERISADLAYRWDGVHVYTPGANLIFQTIVPELLAL